MQAEPVRPGAARLWHPSPKQSRSPLQLPGGPRKRPQHQPPSRDRKAPRQRPRAGAARVQALTAAQKAASHAEMPPAPAKSPGPSPRRSSTFSLLGDPTLRATRRSLETGVVDLAKGDPVRHDRFGEGRVKEFHTDMALIHFATGDKRSSSISCIEPEPHTGSEERLHPTKDAADHATHNAALGTFRAAATSADTPAAHAPAARSAGSAATRARVRSATQERCRRRQRSGCEFPGRE